MSRKRGPVPGAGEQPLTAHEEAVLRSQPPESLKAIERFERSWQREEAAITMGNVATALRAIEERPMLMAERDRAVRHAQIAVRYVHVLRAKLHRAETTIRDLRRAGAG